MLQKSSGLALLSPKADDAAVLPHVAPSIPCPLLTAHPLQVPVLRPMDLMVEATPRRVFANAHTYHINSISVNSDYETYMSADDLRINLWNFEITNQSFSILWCAHPMASLGPSAARSCINREPRGRAHREAFSPF